MSPRPAEATQEIPGSPRSTMSLKKKNLFQSNEFRTIPNHLRIKAIPSQRRDQRKDALALLLASWKLQGVTSSDLPRGR